MGCTMHPYIRSFRVLRVVPAAYRQTNGSHNRTGAGVAVAVTVGVDVAVGVAVGVAVAVALGVGVTPPGLTTAL